MEPFSILSVWLSTSRSAKEAGRCNKTMTANAELDLMLNDFRHKIHLLELPSSQTDRDTVDFTSKSSSHQMPQEAD